MSKLQNNKELSNQEVEEMIAFLKTLTDIKYLTDKRFSEY